MLSGGGSGLAAASSSSSVASRLYASSQQRNSRRNSFSSDAPAEAGELMSFNDISDFNHSFNEANNELSKMSQRMRELQDLQLAATEEKSRLKTENAVLQERVHLYEEQLQTAEQIWSEKLDEEKHRLKDILARVTREKELEAEKDALRYQVLEGQLKAVQREKERAEEQAHNCQCKANTLRDQLHELQAECERIESEKHQLKTEFERYQLDTLDRMENMETNAEILEQLHRQSDQIRSFPRQGSLTDQIMMLEDEVERLKIENRNLREQNKDMQAQILHDSVECGRTLLDNGSTAAPSLAAELGGMDSQGLMNALREQELVNQRLRNYVNGILMRIIERHPDILEIKEGEDGTQPPPRPSTILSNDSDVNKTTNHKSDSEGCPAGTIKETKCQPVNPPSSKNNTAFKRSSGERMSLRFLWYGNNKENSTSCTDNNMNNNKNNKFDEGGVIGAMPGTASVESTSSQSTFAKRLYNSLVGQEWNLFGRHSNSTATNSNETYTSSSPTSIGNADTVVVVSGVISETPPPDPSPPGGVVLSAEAKVSDKMVENTRTRDELDAEKKVVAETFAQYNVCTVNRA